MSTPQSAADALKVQANALYKSRSFDAAIPLYLQAWETYPDITYLNNLSAVYFEQGEYEKCVETCLKAVEEGRERRADFKVVAKAYARLGSAYAKQEKLDEAVKALNKSLTEHRTPDVLAKLKEAEKAKSEAEKHAYIDPSKSNEAREIGNKAFKSSDFPLSILHYTESIKRNPLDARGYTNRAAAYTKLLALPEALKDAEKAIEVQPDFVKGYIRKSHVLFAMKEYSKSLSAIEEAAIHDLTQNHTSEITTQIRKINAADSLDRQGESDEQAYARAMRDPEIQQIMSDPVFQSILQQAQGDPESLKIHMRNEEVRGKVEKLVKAGIIKTR